MGSNGRLYKPKSRRWITIEGGRGDARRAILMLFAGVEITQTEGHWLII
jgi:hypothetical protein